MHSITDKGKSFFNGIKKISPGKVFKWSKEYGLEEKLNFSMNSLEILLNNKNDFLEFSEITKEKFIKSTKLHLNADVEVGVSLSSGVDSSLLASLIKNCNENRKLKAFSVKFEGFDNETKDASEFAKKNQFDHVIIRMTMDQY